MKELVIKNSSGNGITTSIIVAEIFGKRHDNVLRDIENLSCSPEFSLLNFEETPYPHPQNGQMYKMYQMTKDGFSFLVMGYTGEKASEFKERFINEFNKREDLLKNDDYILQRSQEILANRIQLIESKFTRATEVIKLQESVLKEQAPTVKYAEKVLESKTGHPITIIAKELNMSAVTLNRILKDRGVQYKVGGTWVLTSKYINRGYTDTTTFTQMYEGEERTHISTVWTEKGRQFLHSLFNSNLKTA